MAGPTRYFCQEDEQLYKDIIEFMIQIDEISISLLQRKFRIGYNRSARLIERLQAEGVIMQEPGRKRGRFLNNEQLVKVLKIMICTVSS